MCADMDPTDLACGSLRLSYKSTVMFTQAASGDLQHPSRLTEQVKGSALAQD